MWCDQHHFPEGNIAITLAGRKKKELTGLQRIIEKEAVMEKAYIPCVKK